MASHSYISFSSHLDGLFSKMLWQSLIVLLFFSVIAATPSYQIYNVYYAHTSYLNSYSITGLAVTVTTTETCNGGSIIGSLNTGTQVWSVSSVWLELTGGSYYIKGCLSGCKSSSNCVTTVSSPALDTLTTSCNSAGCGPSGCYCTSYYINKGTKCMPSAQLLFP